MKKIFKIEFLGSIASIVALAFFLYYQFFVSNNPTIEVFTLSKEELTQLPNEKGLEVQYTFNSEKVKSLYKIRFRLKNIGGKTIIGTEGGDLLERPLKIVNKNQDNKFIDVLNLEITDKNFPIELDKDSINYNLDFKQWKNNEYVEFVAYLNNRHLIDNIQGFTINHRSILNCELVENVYQATQTTYEPKLIDNFTSSFKNALWWIVIVGYILMVIASLPTAFKSSKEQNEGKMLFWFFWLILMLILLAPFLWMINS